MIGVPIAYGISRVLKLRPQPLTITGPRRQVNQVLLVLIGLFASISIFRIIYHTIAVPTLRLDLRPSFTVEPVDLLFEVFRDAVILLPLIILMKTTGRNRASIGITGNNATSMLAFGLALGMVDFAIVGSSASFLGGGFAGFSISQAYSFVSETMTGFTEETVWRGYVQPRLVAYGGTLKGVTSTSLIFALFHFPRDYFLSSGAVLEALASAMLLFPIGLLFGYVMLRSQNIVPSSIFHLFFNWSQFFFRYPSI